jgi:hypothetical protein
MKNDQFHIPFLHSLIFIASCTIISIVLAHSIVVFSFSKAKNQPDFATQKFDIHTNTTDNNPL